MRQSPSQKFQRTNKIFLSPNNNRMNESPKHFNSPGRGRFISAYTSQKGSQYFNSNHSDSEHSGNEPQVNMKLNILEKELKTQKERRKAQYSELLEIIRNLSMRERINMKFDNQEMEFPTTPRIRTRDMERITERDTEKCRGYGQFTPLSSKRESKEQMKSYHNSGYQSTPTDFSIKILENLLQKIHYQSEDNYYNISKLQQEIVSLKSSVAKSNQLLQNKVKFPQVPIEFQRYVKDQCRLLKAQLQMSRNDKLQHKFKLFRSEIMDELKQIEHMNEKKLFNMKESILEQIHKNSQQIEEIMSREKKRVDQIEEENKFIFDQFQKTIENINQKVLKASKFAHHEKQKLDVAEMLRQEKQKLLQELNKEIKINLNESQNTITKDVQNILNRLQNLEETTSHKKSLGLVKYNSMNIQKQATTQKNSGPNSEVHEMDFSFECTNSTNKMETIPYELSKKFSDQYPQFEQVIHVISQNCNYLQERSIAIEQSMSQIVWVLNGLLEKVKGIM